MFKPFRAALFAAACLPAAALAEPLTLQDAIARTLASAPQATVAVARADALAAARIGADTKPSPSIDFLGENLGVGGRDLNDQIQLEAAYSQRIERGGKRAARIAVADRDIDIARAQAIVASLDVAATAQKLYVEAQAAQAQIDIARERVTVAEALNREVTKRVNAARDPLFAGSRARAQVAEAKLDLEMAIHRRDAAVKRLSALWKGTPDGIEISNADFLTFDRVASGNPLSAPDTAVYTARSARADAYAGLQRSEAVRDPTVSAGPRYLVGTGDVALVAGVSLPLGSRRLNQARIAGAEAQRRQAEAELAVERFERARAIDLAEEEVEESRHEAEGLRDGVLPIAERTLAEVRAGYNRGGFSFLDVSSAQAALFDTRTRLITAAHRYHDAGVELDRLTGRFADLAQEPRP